jgi:hypothetical protein
MIRLGLLVIAAICCQSLLAAEVGQARLLVSKNVLNTMIVQGHDLMIEYKIYNVGERLVSIKHYCIVLYIAL